MLLTQETCKLYPLMQCLEQKYSATNCIEKYRAVAKPCLIHKSLKGHNQDQVKTGLNRFLRPFQVIKVKEDKDKFEVTLDVSQYRPEELKVSTVNNVLSIEGKHEEEVCRGHSVTRW